MSLKDTPSKNGRTLLDRPTYNASEVGRLADLKPDRVRRWLRGYSYSHAGGVHRKEPVIRRSGNGRRQSTPPSSNSWISCS